MRKILYIISLIGIFVFIVGCSSKFIIPEEPIRITVSNVCMQSNKLAGFIAEEQYERLYREVFSDSLKNAVSFQDFSHRLHSFTEDYGELKLRFSGMASCQQIESDRYMVSYVLQYKDRTVFTEFIFKEVGTGEDPKVLLAGYRFIDQ